MLLPKARFSRSSARERLTVSNPERRVVVNDTSVLINFLAIDQARLLVEHSQYEFLLTDHARAEITEHYPKEFGRLEIVLSEGSMRQLTVNTPEELEIFAALALGRRLGPGECAAIAAAVYRKGGVALDDRAAMKQIYRLYPETPVETTQSLVVGLIGSGVLSVSEADLFKEQWQSHHRFRLPFRSFGEVL